MMDVNDDTPTQKVTKVLIVSSAFSVVFEEEFEYFIRHYILCIINIVYCFTCALAEGRQVYWTGALNKCTSAALPNLRAGLHN